MDASHSSPGCLLTTGPVSLTRNVAFSSRRMTPSACLIRVRSLILGHEDMCRSGF